MQRRLQPRRMKHCILLMLPWRERCAHRSGRARSHASAPGAATSTRCRPATASAEAEAAGHAARLREAELPRAAVLGEAVPAAAAVVVGVAVAVEMNKRTCGASANKDIGTRSWRTMLTSSSMVSRRCWRR